MLCVSTQNNECTHNAEPHHKCDWETRMTTDKKVIADYTWL